MPTQRNGCGFLGFSWVLFWFFVCLVGFGFGFKFNVRTCWFDIILAANILMTRRLGNWKQLQLLLAVF